MTLNNKMPIIIISLLVLAVTTFYLGRMRSEDVYVASMQKHNSGRIVSNYYLDLSIEELLEIIVVPDDVPLGSVGYRYDTRTFQVKRVIKELYV